MLFLVLLFILAPVNSEYYNVTEKVNNVLSNPCTDKNHLVLAPGVLTAGGTNRACVSRFYPEGQARLLLTLFTEDRQMNTASRELPPGDGGCLDFNVPLLPNTKAELSVNIRYLDAQCVWERRLSLRIASGRVLVVQTERARYRPGETVRARVLALKPDLSPLPGQIDEVWLEGPRGAWEGTRISQWMRLRTRLGLAQLQYQLDDLAPPGKWTLRAKLGDGSQGSAVFRVGHYELPPFQLSVRHAPKVLRSSERLAWTVCVRYPWSEAVEGMLVIRLRGAGGGGTGVRTAVQLRAPKACHRHAVAAKRVGLHSQNPPDVLVADFSFQEEGTRIWQNTTVVSQVVDKPISLEFLTKHRAVISPGLPYILKVKATRWDDKPAASEHIRVCRYTTLTPAGEGDSMTSQEACAEGETDSGGVAKVMFAAVKDDAPFYRFEARLSNDTSTVARVWARVRRGRIQAALGALRGAGGAGGAALLPLYISGHVATPLTVHFVVITRGGTIYRWGATTQCPTSGSVDQIRTTPRDGKCNANYYGYSHDHVSLSQRDSLASYDDIAQKKLTPDQRKRRCIHIPKDEYALDTDQSSPGNPNNLQNYFTTEFDAHHETTANPSEEFINDLNTIKNDPGIGQLMRPESEPTAINYEIDPGVRNGFEPSQNEADDNDPTANPWYKADSDPNLVQSDFTTAQWNISETDPNSIHSLPSMPQGTPVNYVSFPQKDLTYHEHASTQWHETRSDTIKPASNDPITSPSQPPASWQTMPQRTPWPTKTSQHTTWQTKPPVRRTSLYTKSPQRFTNVPTKDISSQYWANPAHNDVNPQRIDTTKIVDVIDNATTVKPDALLDRKLKIMLPIKVTHQMCPDSHLIAYFYYNGELVSASKHFEMEECFANKVEANWLSRQALPGSTVSLQVSTPGPALCALTVLDMAAKWVKPPPTTKELLMNNLRRLIDSHRNLTEYDAAGDCFLNSDIPDTPSSGLELTSTWLASAGIRLLGGEAPSETVKHCDNLPPAAMLAEEPVARTDFSEAWLWRLLPIGANGTGVASARAPDSITRFEAGATCMTRTGVAMSPPAVLQVFREFFIHADSPRRLRQGDTAIIRYRIFNYLYDPLSVQIQILADPHIEVPSEVVETACVGARSSVAKRVRIRARVATPARISLRAKAVNDGNCPNVTSNSSVSDEVIIKITVDHVGVPIHEQKSILLCGNGSAAFSTSKVEWKWPLVPIVPGTESLTLWTVGDVTGPLLADADSLVLIPRGCGEQNMAQLATNLLALQQLDSTSIAALTAREHVARGFTRQLQYVHPSGGFSAFGPSDATSSTWLTAFAVRHLRKAHKLLWPNLQVPPALIRAERWLLNQQMENGCFGNEGQVFHRELRGGLSEEGEIASVALTAYVITSLIESTTIIPHLVLRNTLSCLRAFPPMKTQTPTRVYAHALLAYAYMKLEKFEEDQRKTNAVSMLRNVGLEQDEGVRQVMELLKIAKRSGGYVWWEASSLSTSIEATSYALLAIRSAPPSLLSWGGASDATAAMRWLASHRTVSGGFISTQDTLVALEALTAWSSNTSPTHLNVTARCDNLAQTVTLLPGVKIPDVMKLTPGERLRVNVEGTGCALVQATRSYHTLSPPPNQEKLLSVQVAVHTDGPFNCDTNVTNCFCAAVIEACVMWSNSFPEMALLEVSLPGGYGADAQLLYSQLHKPQSLLRRIELTPTNTRATFYLGSRDGSAPSGDGGHQCYNIHAVGPRASTRPAYAKVLDYYVPTHNDTQFFTIPEECPPRITHNAPQYISSDNLFSKARSLNGDEILITHEFSFEDIPDGIPLEDPLYDNLTRRKGEESKEVAHIEILSKNNETTHSKEVNSTVEDITVKHDIKMEAKPSDTRVKHQPIRGHFDKFTLNNVEGTSFYNAGKSRLRSKGDDGVFTQHTELRKHNIGIVDSTRNIKKPIHTEDTTVKNVMSEKIQSKIQSQPIPVPTINKAMDNPSLVDFHVIDTEKDLDVPSGVEGPVPTIVLPPADFVPPPQSDTRRLKTIYTPHGPYNYFRPEEYIGRTYFEPRPQFTP